MKPVSAAAPRRPGVVAWEPVPPAPGAVLFGTAAPGPLPAEAAPSEVMTVPRSLSGARVRC